MSMPESKFFGDVAKGLAGCQRVEQQLKLYLHEAFSFAHECINGRMPFKFRGEDVKDYSLERLIQTFKKLSDDEQLVRDLNRFKDERNFLSHQAITHCYDYGGDYSQTTAREIRPRILAVERDAQDLVERIWALQGRLLVERHFENLDEQGRPNDES